MIVNVSFQELQSLGNNNGMIQKKIDHIVLSQKNWRPYKNIHWRDLQHENNELFWKEWHKYLNLPDTEKYLYKRNEIIYNLNNNKFNIDKQFHFNNPHLGNDNPLHFALKNNDYDLVYILLKYGANPLLKGCWGNTPLDIITNIFSSNIKDEIKLLICDKLQISSEQLNQIEEGVLHISYEVTNKTK